MTWYMGRANARPRVIRGTRTAPLPLLPSGPGGVCSRPLHGARDLTSIHRIMRRGWGRFLAAFGPIWRRQGQATGLPAPRAAPSIRTAGTGAGRLPRLVGWDRAL